MSRALALEDVRDAEERISRLVNATPVRSDCTSHVAPELARDGVVVHLKCEMFQRGGSFKLRGASNAIEMCAMRDRKIVTCHSSGNHASAVAMAARARGMRAIIVVPRDIAKSKLEATLECGAEVRFSSASTVPAREAAVREVMEEFPEAAFIHPYNDVDVMAGQGTIGLEFLRQVPELDVVVVPISGGGMIGGIATAVKGINPNIEIWAAEPCGVDGQGADAAMSRKCGARVDSQPPPKTICDGLRAKMGDKTWDTFDRLVDKVVEVTDQDVLIAMRCVYEKCKLVVEPSGAAAVAAIMVQSKTSDGLTSVKTGARFRNIGVILCGGNLDLEPLFRKIQADIDALSEVVA